jgi:hypothetical protein
VTYLDNSKLSATPSGGLRMNKVTINLENCWGIGKLKHNFDFGARRVYALYAPNGCMKTSLAKTFLDVTKDEPSKDHYFADRVSVREILDENGKQLSKDDIVILSPYKPPLEDATNAAILLGNSELRKQYEKFQSDTEKAKVALIKALKTQAKCKAVEKEISLVFTFAEDNFIAALEYPQKQLHDSGDAPYSDLPYDTVFDEKVLQLLQEPDIKAALDDFIVRYNELIGASTYFRKGTFEYYNASSIAKHLEQQGFFKAKHFVTLNGTEKVEITSKAQLEQKIADEKGQITSDPALRAKFGKIEDSLLKNQAVKDFREYILNNEAVLSKMTNINNFKQEVWKSYLREQLPLYDALMNAHETAKEETKAIMEKAKKETPDWDGVIDVFNDRFATKVVVKIKNRNAVVVGQADPLMEFSYKDGTDIADDVKRDLLLETLSEGEKKALYILDILFDVQVRKNRGEETLFIFDDIADSFDYKNKYAIIQYLTDISKDPHFKMILLTHNFDFYRTVCSRFVGHDGSFLATRNEAGVITIEKPDGIQNIFINVWKKSFFKDIRRRIACISFMRNLIEYTKSTADPDYLTLTSLVHIKPNTRQITQKQIDEIYNRLFGPSGNAWQFPDSIVIDDIEAEAQKCLGVASGVQFEYKVVLSIAIRLAAELFMFAKINDPNMAFDNSQTKELVERFEGLFRGETKAIKTLQSVLLMTPENIHLNAFMYEPIVDLSDDHLTKLYREVLKLQ